MKFKVREFKSSTQYFNIEEHGDQLEFEETKDVQDVPEEDLNDMCWFCWINEYTEQNPKIGTCNCIGTVKYIHYECLKAWLHTKMTNKQSENAHTLSWKHFECELCKMHYPYQFWYKNKLWHLVEIPRPKTDDPYIILESMNLEKNSSWIIHTIMLGADKKKFSLGRGHDSDLRINDISVSRLHATIEYKNGEFYLED